MAPGWLGCLRAIATVLPVEEAIKMTLGLQLEVLTLSQVRAILELKPLMDVWGSTSINPSRVPRSDHGDV
jgi:hypothetical protein